MSKEKENLNNKEEEAARQIIKSKEFYYNCSECSSPIEISSINEIQIEFKCLNNNHIKKISIKEYLNQMKAFNNINNNNDMCFIHNNKYECYCLDCNINLCKECLKSSNHINHNLKYIKVIEPEKKELNIIENIITYYAEKIEKLEKEKLVKTKELNNKLKKYKNKLKKRRKLKIKKNKNNMETEMKLKYNEYILNINNIRNKYENELKINKNKYEKNINEIQNKYKKVNENNNIIYRNQLENLNNKYSKLVQKYTYTEKINNMNYFKILNQIIYNTYVKYNCNYHNLININFLINKYQNKINNKSDINKGKNNIPVINIIDMIKSFNIFKEIIFHLTSNKQLEIMKYNKKIQNKFEKNINHYKLYSKKYVIYETDKKVKEYNKDDILLFEGDYLKGKRNGKGKEYDYESYLIYEGDHSKGKRNGKGQEYYHKDYLIYEGDYLNGKRNGKGKEYYFKEPIFEGEYLNGKRNGKGKDFFLNKILFEGEYLNGKKWNGKGYDLNNNLSYELKEGKGYLKELMIPDLKIIFEGEYLNGERNGKGKEYYVNGDLKYEGEYLNGKKWNIKVYNRQKNIICEIKEGKGNMKEINDHYNLIYEGEYLNGERNGKGKEFSYGSLIFEGEYLNGLRNGKGKEYIREKLIFEGGYLKGKNIMEKNMIQKVI